MLIFNQPVKAKMDARMQRFEDFVTMIAGHLGHADRVEPFRGYCAGLMLPGKRKSVEPMAARVAPTEVRSAHQRFASFRRGCTVVGRWGTWGCARLCA